MFRAPRRLATSPRHSGRIRNSRGRAMSRQHLARPAVSTRAAAPSSSMPPSAGSSSGEQQCACGSGWRRRRGAGRPRVARLVGPLAREGIEQVTGDGSEGSVGGVGSARLGTSLPPRRTASGLPGGTDPVDMAGWGGDPVTALPELAGIEGAAKGADVS